MIMLKAYWVGPPPHSPISPGHLIWADGERKARLLFAQHVEWADEIAFMYPPYISARAWRAPGYDGMVTMAMLSDDVVYVGSDGVVPSHDFLREVGAFSDALESLD